MWIIIIFLTSSVTIGEFLLSLFFIEWWYGGHDDDAHKHLSVSVPGTWLVVCIAGVFDLLGEQRKTVLDPQQMWLKRNDFSCLTRAKIHTPSLGWIQGIQHQEQKVKETCQQILRSFSFRSPRWQQSLGKPFLGILWRPFCQFTDRAADGIHLFCWWYFDLFISYRWYQALISGRSSKHGSTFWG